MRKVYLLLTFAALFAALTFEAQAQWSLVYNPVGSYVRIQTFTSIGSRLYAGTLNGGVYTSATAANADDWTRSNSGLTDTNVRCLVSMGGTLFAGTPHGIFVSADSGAHWAASDSGLTSPNIAALFVDETTVLAGTEGGGMYLSTDQGGVWTAPVTPPAEAYVIAFAKSDSFLFASATNYSVGKVYRSSDGGATWTEASAGIPATFAILDLRASGHSVIASVYQSGTYVVYASQDDGLTWSAASGVPATQSNHFASSGPNFFAGTYGSGYYLSTDGGANWSAVNQGYGTVPCSALEVAGAYLFAGGFDGGVYRRALSQMVTSVRSIDAPLPARYALAQNYPNPFNPTTSIAFDLPEASLVTLVVHNSLGQVVAELLRDEMIDGGAKAVTLDASGLASGLYIASLRAKSLDGAKLVFSGSMKMLLVR